jgi:hypothetical protein
LRKIARSVEEKILMCWLQGNSQRQAASEFGVGLATVNRVITDAKKKTPSLDDLRQLNVTLKKSGVALVEAVRASPILVCLDKLGVGIDGLGSFIKLSERISSERGVEAESFIDAGMRLMGLEAKTGKSYEGVLKDFEERIKQIESLESKTKGVQEEIQRLMDRKAKLRDEIRDAEQRLSSTRQELDKAVNTDERLKTIGLEKISDLARFVEDFELLGFDANMVRMLAEWRRALLKMGVDPDELDVFIREKGTLESQVLTLRTEAKRLKGVVEALERRKKDLVDENSSLFTVSKILESRRASLPCRRCGWPIPIGLDRKENYMSMINQGLGLGVWCPSCGYQNLFDAREVIFNVGWMVLPT